MSYLDGDIDDKELMNDIGINKKPHRRKILKEIAKLIKLRGKSRDKSSDNDILTTIENEMNELKKRIEKEKQNVEQHSNIKKYFQRLQQVKKHKKFKRLKDRNCELNDLEVLAILFYCDEDKYCYKMRKSQREEGINSCNWKNLYHYLCRAADKIYHVLHYKNPALLKQRQKCDLLHGSTVCDLNKDTKKCLHLNQMTSFTNDWSVAHTFSKRIMKEGEKNGMILVIKDANKALYSGELRGADVSWISQHQGENEFLIFPTTFYNFEYVSHKTRMNNGWCIPEDHNMYITSKVESTNITFTSKDIKGQVDALAAWWPTGSKYYDEILPIVEHILFIFMMVLGPWITLKCTVCNIESRIFDYAGSYVDLTKECPSCRSYIFQSDGADTDYSRRFTCNNPECEPKNGKISRCDLKKIDDDEKLDPEDGYKCIKCKKQQKSEYHRALREHDPTITAKKDNIINSISKIIARYNILLEDESYHIENKFHEPDKKKLKKLIKYMHTNLDAKPLDVIMKFPIIWKWFSNLHWIKRFLNAYKDNYTGLVEAGFINNEDGIPFNGQTGEILGGFLQNKFNNQDDTEINAGEAFLNMIGFQLGVVRGIKRAGNKR